MSRLKHDYKVEKEFIAKVTDSAVDAKESPLSNLDLITGPTRVHFFFFYDYIVPPVDLERALMQTVNRYPETAGKFLSPFDKSVKLTNEGVLMEFLEPANVTIEELKKSNFNPNLLFEHFDADMFAKDPHLCKITVQNLANDGGMLFRFGFNHKLGDGSAMYGFLTDFASQCTHKKFKFDESQVFSCKRLQVLHPSGNEPTKEHPEMSWSAEPMQIPKGPPVWTVKLAQTERRFIKLYITAEKLEALKTDVCKLRAESAVGLRHVQPSSNDCLWTTLWRAVVSTADVKTVAFGNPDKKCTLQMAMNCRGKLDLPVPVSYMGNVVCFALLETDISALEGENGFETAAKLRNKIGSVDATYVQSVVDYVDKRENASIRMDTPFRFLCSNINGRDQDWFADMDLGQGKPECFTVLNSFMNMNFSVFPTKNGRDLEILTAFEKEHMGRFLEHEMIQKYFVLL